MSRSLSACFAAVAVVAAAGCGYQHSTNLVAPTSTDGSRPSNNAPTGSGPLVGTWTSNALPSVPTNGRCGNFQYQITSQTPTTIGGTFTGICAGGLTISGNANGQLDGTNVALTITGAANGPGFPNCPITLTGNGAIEDNGNTLRMPFSGTTCLGPVSGTEVLRRPQPAAEPTPTPAPAPEPQPAPAPAPAPTSDDAVDIHQITVVGSVDVRDWPATAKIRVLDFSSSGVAIDFTKKEGPGRWPDVVPNGWDGPIQYTVWMVVNHGGRLYTAGGVEFWHGLGRSGGPPSQFANNWYYNPQLWAPLTFHQPGVGEQVGFFVTAGDQRAKDAHIVAERSNIVVISFPSDSGGYYPF
jgi:hypothetical protein